MKEYVGISRDHSGSMVSIAKLAMKDFNEQLAALVDASNKHNVNTIVSVMKCSIGEGTWVHNTVNLYETVFTDVNRIKSIASYPTTGRNTQLFDSVMTLIQDFEKVPDYNSPDVAFTLMILTDGGDNASKTSAHNLAQKIKQLQSTDKWTITFRVPVGEKARLAALGIPAGNILEVDYNSNDDVRASTIQTTTAINNKYVARTKGLRSVSSFYADTSNLSTETIRSQLKNVTHKVRVLPVSKAHHDFMIKDFIEAKLGVYTLGSAYYELSKREKLQAGKDIIVWDRNSGHYYTGEDARSLLGLPKFGDVTLVPGNMPQFEVFIQSNSVNRKLKSGTKVVVMKD